MREREITARSISFPRPLHLRIIGARLSREEVGWTELPIESRDFIGPWLRTKERKGR